MVVAVVVVKVASGDREFMLRRVAGDRRREFLAVHGELCGAERGGVVHRFTAVGRMGAPSFAMRKKETEYGK